MRNCQYCNKELTKRYQLSFCGSSCAAKHNNRNKANKKVTKHAELIQKLIEVQTPISDILKQVNISRCTFKRLYPDYKGLQGAQKTLRHKQYANEIFSMIDESGVILTDNLPQNHKFWFKKYLISKQGAKCSQCGWGKAHPITGNVMIELDHIDGNPHNNKIDNVRLLCPNCHSLTPTFRNVKRKGNSI